MIQQEKINIQTTGRGFYPVDSQILALIEKANVAIGLCNIYIPHTSASLIISENADPQVLTDLEAFMSRLAPDGDPLFQHTAEGPDDMSAHVRSVLTQTSLVIPITSRRLTLGTWQGVFLWEHRHKHHRRELLVTILS